MMAVEGWGTRGGGHGASVLRTVCGGVQEQLLPLSTGPPKLLHSAVLKTSRPMVAAFDYNPRENSPNMDVEVRTFIRCPDDAQRWGVE